MRIFRLIIPILVLAVTACNRHTDEYISPCPMDTNFFHKEGGVTKEESIAFRKAYYDQLKLNTIGRKVPGLTVYDSTGKVFNLAILIDRPAIIYSFDSHCSFGLEGAENVFPKAIEKLRQDNFNFKAIILFEKSKYDLNNPERFEKYKKELQGLYENFFIIDDTNARKLNIWGCPYRMITTKHAVVTYLNSGLSTPERLYEELKEQLKIVTP